MHFEPFGKIGRIARTCVITEKLDGTNAQIAIEPCERETADQYIVARVDNLNIYAGSRNRWLKAEKKEDNYGFAEWVKRNAVELAGLGAGRHYGEWWGQGIQRGYGLQQKHFSLFNSGRWGKIDSGRPSCCGVVPVLYSGLFSTEAVEETLTALKLVGSQAAPGFKDPEGIIVFHNGTNTLFKKTFDDNHKG